ncbi:hypothetical protein Pelo_3742 [Pelomyxa schiedti]|nr:hypothetical protein Pelo_3742 [Pelomyxa schiedti]
MEVMGCSIKSVIQDPYTLYQHVVVGVDPGGKGSAVVVNFKPGGLEKPPSGCLGKGILRKKSEVHICNSNGRFRFTPTYLTVRLANHKRDACLDSGSGYSLISANILKEIQASDPRSIKKEADFIGDCLTAGKTELQIDKSVTLAFWLAGRML